MAVEEILTTLGILIIMSALLAFAMRSLKQPPLVAYLLTGLLVGYFGFELAEDKLDLMIELGIVLMLFIAGLEMRLKDITSLGKKTLVVGWGHDILMFAAGFCIAHYLMGLGVLASIYVAFGITLSSTIVVLKALNERKELSSPHGKVLVGTMILQDVGAMIFLAIVTSLDKGGDVLVTIPLTLVKIFLTAWLFYFVGTHFLRFLFTKAARSIELVFLLGLAWCFVGIGVAYLLDFSIAIGAFIAGLAIAHLPFTFEIKDKVRSLQDFGVILFFLSVGMHVTLTKSLFLNPYFYVLTAFVIFFTLFITSFIASFMQFTKKESFILSFFPTQISEFTLIILAVGLSLNHITNDTFSMITLVVVATIALSSSYLSFTNQIFKRIGPRLSFLEWRTTHHTQNKRKDLRDHIVIIGFKKLGQDIAKYYKEFAKDIVVIEWKPEYISMAESLGVHLVYGDAGDSDLWEEINLHKAHVIVSTIGNNEDDDLHLLSWLKEKDSNAYVILESNDEQDAQRSYKSGADYVLVHDRLEWEYLENNVLKKATKNLYKKFAKPPHNLSNHVVIFGYKKLGKMIADYCKKKNIAKDVVVVEWEPKALQEAKEQGIEIVVGDASEESLWKELKLPDAKMIVSTIGKNQEDDLLLLTWLSQKQSSAYTILETNSEEEAKQLKKAGADYVLVHDQLEWTHLKKQVLFPHFRYNKK